MLGQSCYFSRSHSGANGLDSVELTMNNRSTGSARVENCGKVCSACGCGWKTMEESENESLKKEENDPLTNDRKSSVDKFKGYEHKDVNMQRIRDKAVKLKSDLLENFEKQLNDVVEDFVQEVEKIEQSPTVNGIPKTHSRKNGELSGKVFIARRSILSELLEISHIRTIYHIFVAILIVFMLNTLVCDFMDQGRVVLDFQLIMFSFGKFPLVMSVWFCMASSTALIVYPLFQYWAYNRKPGKAYWVDYVWLLLYIIYQLIFLVVPVKTVHTHSIPAASSVVIVTEQVRLIMKAHAFVRENIPKAVAYDKSKWKVGDDLPCPDFSKYLYFLFAPTLIYRDAYPRNPGPVRWNYVVSNFAQVLACLFYIYYIFERFCIPVFRNFNREFVTPRRLIVSVFGSMLPGTLVLFIAFFAILHSWLNAFAEMLRFSDRLFYKDWWNSSSFANYYRTWNIVVHDWLYTYIYKDVYLLLGFGYRGIAMATVFLLSAIVHEYILSVAFGFIYPVLFIMFAGAGFAFIFLPSKAQRSGNIFMWVALFIGNGILMCLYSMEWYARISCPASSDSFVDYFIPRSWGTCEPFSSLQEGAAGFQKTEL